MIHRSQITLVVIAEMAAGSDRVSNDRGLDSENVRPPQRAGRASNRHYIKSSNHFVESCRLSTFNHQLSTAFSLAARM